MNHSGAMWRLGNRGTKLKAEKIELLMLIQNVRSLEQSSLVLTKNPTYKLMEGQRELGDGLYFRDEENT